ncbi:hypothetical protein ELQ92_08895 [Labedella populi]|uniref:Uncharacterized protein n=1 Tax=Labedella populi TaxID=2498850 RepID=A0A3S4A609_9MICO|nr:hypothetical protein [Labedella populi]RWZ61147.1 hypothetical protein ELQ92_08895 [Labedella populi]
MVLRRAFYYWQFVAALVLPLWLFVGWGFSSGSGWSFVGLLVLAPILFVFMLVVSVVVYMRSSVRRANAVSWWDVGVIGAWHASIVAFGFFADGNSAIAVLGVALALASFWSAAWQLVSETRAKAREALREFEQMTSRPERPRPPVVDGGVYIVTESRDDRIP